MLGVFLSWISSLCCGPFSGTNISIHLFFPILCTFPHLHSGSFSHLPPRIWVLITDAILYILLHFLSFLNVKPATKRQEMHRKTWQCWTGLSQWSRSALTQHAVTDSFKSGYFVGYKADFLLKHKYPVTLYLMIHRLSSCLLFSLSTFNTGGCHCYPGPWPIQCGNITDELHVSCGKEFKTIGLIDPTDELALGTDTGSALAFKMNNTHFVQSIYDMTELRLERPLSICGPMTPTNFKAAISHNM